MSIFQKYTVTQVLYSVLGVFVFGFLALALFGGWQIKKIMVHGPIYNEVMQGKDLIAEIFPPTAYISESYLNVLELETENDPSRIVGLITKAERLKAEYIETHARWIREMKSHQGDELSKMLLEESYLPVMEFFKVRDNLFIPSIKLGEPPEKRELMLHRMKAAFFIHRRHIDKAVKLVAEKNRKTEMAGEKNVSQAIFTMIGLSIFFLGFFTYFTIGLCAQKLRTV